MKNQRGGGVVCPQAPIMTFDLRSGGVQGKAPGCRLGTQPPGQGIYYFLIDSEFITYS